MKGFVEGAAVNKLPSMTPPPTGRFGVGTPRRFLLAATAQNLRKLAKLILPTALKPA